MIFFGVCIRHKGTPETLWDGLYHSLSQLLLLANLFPSFIDNQPTGRSHSPARSFAVSTRSFLSVHNSQLLEHFHVAVSELEHEDPLDLGEVKLLTFQDRFDHFCITSIWFLFNFRPEWSLKIRRSLNSNSCDYYIVSKYCDLLKIYLHFCVCTLFHCPTYTELYYTLVLSVQRNTM